MHLATLINCIPPTNKIKTKHENIFKNNPHKTSAKYHLCEYTNVPPPPSRTALIIAGPVGRQTVRPQPALDSQTERNHHHRGQRKQPEEEVHFFNNKRRN